MINEQLLKWKLIKDLSRKFSPNFSSNVDFIIKNKWKKRIFKNMKKRYDYYTDGEWRVCKPLTKDCKDIVGDLMNSVNVAHHWPREKQQQYFLAPNLLCIC